jgi:hypothetical protein
MPYLATIAIDYTGANPNAYAKLQTALLQSGWEYSETSTLYVESDDLDVIQRGLAVLAHGVASPGMLSNLSITIQYVGDPRVPAAARNHPRALEQILDIPLPF